jgi:hypothetical protein
MRSIVVALLVLIGATAPSAAFTYKGWFVVVGAFPLEPSERQSGDLKRMSAAAARCGVETFNDFSGKFRGFAPGHNVFVLGAFASRARADAKAREVKRCFPGAYVKYGEHLGE